MKVSKQGRRRQAERVYQAWSVKFLARMYPRAYRNEGHAYMRRIIDESRAAGVFGAGINVWYDRKWSETGRL